MPGADPTEYAIRLGLWLAARRENPHRDTTTFVTAKPIDRPSSAYTIAESDVEATLAENAQLEQQRDELRYQICGAQARIDHFESRSGAVYAMALLESEIARLREENARLWNLNGNSYTSGWHDALAWSPGSDEREAGWRQYRENMAELMTKAAPQQPERTAAADVGTCVCGCGLPDDDTGMCHCPMPCPCEPDCAFCLAPNPMRQSERG